MSAGDYSYASVFWMYSLMALFAAGSVFFLVKAIRSGAVKDDEAPKYRMLDDDVLVRRGNDLVGGKHGEQP